MIRRLTLFLVSAGIGWMIYSRVRRQAAINLGEQAGDGSDGAAGGLGERVSRVAAETAATARGVAQAPLERARTLVGGDGDHAASRGEQAATPGHGPAPERRVKGNIRHDGERIYHLPDDPAYESVQPEATFASIEEAEAAGFRRAGRPS